MHHSQAIIGCSTSNNKILIKTTPKHVKSVPARRHLEAPSYMHSATIVSRAHVPQEVRYGRAPARAYNPVHLKMLETTVNTVNVTFKVQYKCSYGQSVALVGDVAALGRWSSSRGQRMKWGHGDDWTSSVMLPAGSSLEFKYVIIDDHGREVRWQEGSNMHIKVPATSNGQPIQKYDVHVSWCKTITSFRAKTLNTSTGAVFTGTHSPHAGSAASPQVPQPDAREAVLATAWALAKGSKRPAPSQATRQAISNTGQPARPPARQLQLAVASASSSSLVTPHVTTPAPISQLASHHAVSPPSTVPLTVAATRDNAPNSLVKALVQAAANALVDQPGIVSPAPSTPTTETAGLPPAVPAVNSDGFVLLSSCQLSPASSDKPMSIVLPSRRASSPPVTISLSSSFSRLMEMPASVLRTAAATATASTGGGCSSSLSNTSYVPGSSVSSTNTVAAAAAVAAVQGNHLNNPGTITAPSLNVSCTGTGTSSIRKSISLHGITDAPSVSPLSNGKTLSHDSVSQSMLPSRIPITPTWGHEYDVYAAAYGIPYISTPFDLDAYTDLPSTGPIPTSQGSVGLGSSTSTPLIPGQDVLETVLQSLHSMSVRDSSISAPKSGSITIGGGDMTATVNTIQPALPGPTQLLNANRLTATAASTAPTLGSAPSPSEVPYTPDTSAVSPSASSSTASTTDAYRRISRCSSSVSDWAGRTLIQLNAGRSLEDEDSDEETADDDAAFTQAVTSPTGPADMAALLKQLGTALGRSVRMRYDGADAASTDLLELDRAIALVSSKLYRQRDSLLTGWVRKETRRQLVAVTTSAADSSRPASNSSLAC